MNIMRRLRRMVSGKPASGGWNAFVRRVVSLEPQGATVGRILLSYITDPFLAGDGAAPSNTHTHHWESRQIAQTFLDRGYGVDVIHYLNRWFVPEHPYHFLVSARTDLQRLAGHLPPDCIKLAHLDTAHWIANNTAAYQRLLSVQQRRRVTLNDPKLVEPNLGIDHADVGTVLGNDYTIDTYRYAGKPLHRIPISAPAVYDWPKDKDFDACRNRYLWFGSSGFVHKGLDLVLEAFAGLPEHHLTVCGPLDQEPEFCAAYHRELRQTPNIDAHGWIDVESEDFMRLMRQSVGLVYPSCAEGGGGSVISCMHAATIPLITHETSVDLGPGCVRLEDISVRGIQTAVRALSIRPAEGLETLARAAWVQAREHHTQAEFARAFAEFVDRVLLPMRQS